MCRACEILAYYRRDTVPAPATIAESEALPYRMQEMAIDFHALEVQHAIAVAQSEDYRISLLEVENIVNLQHQRLTDRQALIEAALGWWVNPDAANTARLRDVASAVAHALNRP